MKDWLDSQDFNDTAHSYRSVGTNQATVIHMFEQLKNAILREHEKVLQEGIALCEQHMKMAAEKTVDERWYRGLNAAYYNVRNFLKSHMSSELDLKECRKLAQEATNRVNAGELTSWGAIDLLSSKMHSLLDQVERSQKEK